MKKVLICYFSCTGNTKLACEYISSKLDAEVELFEIRQEMVPDFSSYALVGFATYTDWCDAPLLMQNFLRWIPQQKDIPAFLFNTCSGLSGKTLKTMHRLTRSKGFEVLAGFTLEAPESCPLLIVRGRTKEDQPSTDNLEAFRQFINNLNNLLKTEPQSYPKFKLQLTLVNKLVPGFPRRTPKIFMGTKHFDQDLCVKCGICRSVCPYQAIDMEEELFFIPNRCAGCWACFNNCPQGAIFTKSIKGRGHYRGPIEAYKKKLDG